MLVKLVYQAAKQRSKPNKTMHIWWAGAAMARFAPSGLIMLIIFRKAGGFFCFAVQGGSAGLMATNEFLSSVS